MSGQSGTSGTAEPTSLPLVDQEPDGIQIFLVEVPADLSAEIDAAIDVVAMVTTPVRHYVGDLLATCPFGPHNA